MKKYIKPNTENLSIELQQMIALSGGGTNIVTGSLQDTDATGDVLSKGSGFFADEDAVAESGLPTFNVWED